MPKKIPDRSTTAILITVGVFLGAVVFAVARDGVWAFIAGGGFFAVASRAARVRHHPAR